MSVYTYKRPGWMKLAQQKRVNLAQRYSPSPPLSVTTHTLLCRLGFGCRSYNGPAQTALHRVRSRTFSAHPPPLPHGIRKGYRALVMEWKVPRPFRRACQRLAPSLSGRFDAGFLQIPHWLSFTGVFLLGQIQKVSSGTLAIVYTFPPFRVMAGLSPASPTFCESLPNASVICILQFLKNAKHHIIREITFFKAM